MQKCTKCGSNAYVGFNTIECSNYKCSNFKLTEDFQCPCCGKKGHIPNNSCIVTPSGEPVIERKEN